MEMLARARILMWQGASVWLVDATPVKGPGPRSTDFHSHHAIQITISLGGHFRLTTADAQLSADAVAVAADAEHAFEAEGLIGFVFMEPESRAGRAASKRLFQGRDLAAIPLDILGDLRERLAAAYQLPHQDDAALEAAGRAVVAALSANTPAQEPDARIRKVIAWAASQIDGPIGLSDAVAISDLSASRLRHLFVEQTGLPFKTYLLWLRLTRALEAFASGASLTEAAHDAGFSDSAHLSRTFRRMFGIAPTALRMT